MINGEIVTHDTCLSWPASCCFSPTTLKWSPRSLLIIILRKRTRTCFDRTTIISSSVESYTRFQFIIEVLKSEVFPFT